MPAETAEVDNDEAIDLIVLVLDTILNRRYPDLASEPCWTCLVSEAKARWHGRMLDPVPAPF